MGICTSKEHQPRGRVVVRVAGDPEVAELFVGVNAGKGLRTIADAKGLPIRIEQRPDRDALGLAMRYAYVRD